MKRRISLLLAVVMILGSFSFAFANDAISETDAGAFLKDNGVLQGINGELKLEDKLRREDAVVMIARLHGAEEEAEAFPTEGLTFKDVKDPYYQSMISWAVANDLIEGHNAEKFGYHEDITAQHYATILLRALGYGEEVAEKAGYDKALELAAELGLLEGVKVENKTPITRGQMALMTYNALGTKMKDSEETLADKLEIEMPKPAALEVEEVKADNLKEVVVRFNQKVDAATVTDANVSVDKNKGSAALAEDGVTVVITMDKALVNQKAYTAVVKGVKSVGGLEIAETKVDFKAFDRTLPEVEDIVVTGPRSFELVFSEPIAKAGTLEIKQDKTKVGHKIGEVGTRRVAVEVYTNLQDGKEYEVTVNGFEDFAEYKNVVNTLKFTYEKDVNPPVAEIVKAEQTYVQVKFNKPVSGLKADQFYHTFNAWNAVGLYKTAEFDAKNAKPVGAKDSVTEVYVLFHDGNEKNQANRPLPEGDVRFGINGANIKDNWGNALGQFETTVKVSADKVAPEVAKVEVTGVNTITVTFNKDVKFAKANVDVLDANEKKISGLDWTVTGSGKKYEIKLIGKDMTGQDITLILSGVTDTALVANKMATYTEVINVTDKSELKVNKVYYSIETEKKDNEDVIVGGELTVIFNKEVDSDTALNVKSYALVYNEGKNVMPLTETPYFGLNSARVIIPLDKYQAAVVNGASLQVVGVKDLAGNLIAPVVHPIDGEVAERTKIINAEVKAEATNKIVVELDDLVNQVNKKQFRLSVPGNENYTDYEINQIDNGVTVLEFILKDKKIPTNVSGVSLAFNATGFDDDNPVKDGMINSFKKPVTEITIKDNKIVDEIAPEMATVEKTNGDVVNDVRYAKDGNTITIKYTENINGAAISTLVFGVKGNTVTSVVTKNDVVTITVKDKLTEAPEITQKLDVYDMFGNGFKAEKAFVAEFDDLTEGPDKTALNAAITEADAKNQDDYTPESWTAFQEALTAAKAMKQDTQEEVDAKVAAINAAIGKLVDKPEVITLESLNAEITSSVAGSYSVVVTLENLKTKFPDATTETVIVLTIGEKTFELEFDDTDGAFVNDDVQVADENVLKAAIVTIR